MLFKTSKTTQICVKSPQMMQFDAPVSLIMWPLTSDLLSRGQVPTHSRWIVTPVFKRTFCVAAFSSKHFQLQKPVQTRLISRMQTSHCSLWTEGTSRGRHDDFLKSQNSFRATWGWNEPNYSRRWAQGTVMVLLKNQVILSVNWTSAWIRRAWPQNNSDLWRMWV